MTFEGPRWESKLNANEKWWGKKKAKVGRGPDRKITEKVIFTKESGKNIDRGGEKTRRLQ